MRTHFNGTGATTIQIDLRKLFILRCGKDIRHFAVHLSMRLNEKNPRRHKIPNCENVKLSSNRKRVIFTWFYVVGAGVLTCYCLQVGKICASMVIVDAARKRAEQTSRTNEISNRCSLWIVKLNWPLVFFKVDRCALVFVLASHPLCLTTSFSFGTWENYHAHVGDKEIK